MRHINRILTVNKLGYQVNHWKTLIIADAVGLSPRIYLVETKDRQTTLNVSVPALLRNNCFNRSTNTHISWSPTLHRSSLYRYSTSKGTGRGPKYHNIEAYYYLITSPTRQSKTADSTPVLPPGFTLSTRHFLVAIRRDIMCKHDVINIQRAHCSLVGPDCKK